MNETITDAVEKYATAYAEWAEARSRSPFTKRHLLASLRREETEQALLRAARGEEI